MNPTDRAIAKEIYRKHMLALDAHVHNIGNDALFKAWTRAHGDWVKAMRQYNIGRFDRESIHEEVLAELATVL